MAGNARVGAVRHALKDRKDDLYETPREAVEALLRCEDLPHTIWEPAAGRKAIAYVLEEHGHDVWCTDLVRRGAGGVHEGIDFLMETQSWLGAQCIVTNPPFKLADEFVRKALDLVPTVYMLLRWAYAEGAGRSDIIDNHLTRIWLGRERLPMMHRDGWDGPKQGGAGQPFAWFVFTQSGPGPEGAHVKRMSWRSTQP